VIVSYALAVTAAVANATSNILQRKANQQEPPEVSMRLQLVADLIRRPVWLAGFATVILSFLLMATALSMGRLAAVEPILVLELPLTLVGASLAFKARVQLREWVAAATMTVGLAGLLALLAPQAGNGGRAPGLAWTVGSVTTLTVIAAGVAVSARSGPRRAALLGAAGGVAFGLTAAYMKAMTVGWSEHGLLGVLLTWQTYAMAASGLVALFLMQNALQAGRLIAAQPGLTLGDPLVAILWGVIVFHETTRGGIFLVLSAGAAALIGLGVFILVRSPLLQAAAATSTTSSKE
jgi:drug/metabolite transporter (DMT)-like permease